MPIPSSITDLSQTAASNYPSGSESPSTLDDTQRAHASFIALLRDGKGQTNQVTLASSTTTDIGGQNSQFVEVTGTTTITSFGATYNGPRYVRFTGALTLTHNATALNLPTSANITTAAGDSCIVIPNTSLNGWNVVAYQRASGAPISGAGTDYLNTTRIDVASATTVNLTSSAPNTRNIRITGTTTITGFTVAIGQTYFVTFNGALTLTNNANIVTQTGANITTTAGDTCVIRATAANTVEVLSYSYVQIPPALLAQKATLGTAVATTSGTAVDFTGIPSWANKITLMLRAVSTNGVSNYLVRIGAGSIDTTGYVSACAYSASTATDTVGFVIANGVAASDLCSGRVTLYRISGNIWVQDGIVSSNVVRSSSGDKSLAGTLDRLRLTTVNGTDTFDAGSVNIMWE